MQKYKSIILFIGVLAVAVLVGCVIGWLGGSGYQDFQPSVAAAPAPTTAPAAPTVAAQSPAAAASKLPKPAAPVAAATVPTPSPEVSVTVTNSDEAAQAIIDGDADDEVKARQLFALLPKLSRDKQAEVAESLTGLVPDEKYAPLGKLLTDAKQPAAVLDVLMTDVSARPNSITLPLMLELIRNPAHPKAAEARDTLKTYLGDDYGTDWAQWQQQITAWLKDNPD